MSNGSCSDAQIFNRSLLREKIEDGSLGLPAPEPLGEGGPDLYYFLLGDDAFALMPWMVKPNSQRQLTREKNSQLQDLRGQEGSKKYYWAPCSKGHRLSEILCLHVWCCTC